MVFVRKIWVWFRHTEFDIMVCTHTHFCSEHWRTVILTMLGSVPIQDSMVLYSMTFLAIWEFLKASMGPWGIILLPSVTSGFFCLSGSLWSFLWILFRFLYWYLLMPELDQTQFKKAPHCRHWPGHGGELCSWIQHWKGMPGDRDVGKGVVLAALDGDDRSGLVALKSDL